MTWVNLEGRAFWMLFVAAFLAVAVWESYQARRELTTPAERRWSRHGLLFAISSIAQAFLFRVSPVALAMAVEASSFGLLNRPWIPFALRCLIAVLVLDLSHYVTHRAFHSISWLWRVHEVHHSDPDYDVSTAARFHPLEVILTQGCNLGLVMLLAPPAVAVFIAEMMGVVVNIIVHANVSLPGRADRFIRAVFVTPNMHRIHHSVELAEQSANFGQAFCWWDRLFGTYLHDAAAGEQALSTGIRCRQGEDTLSLRHLLGAPFQAQRR